MATKAKAVKVAKNEMSASLKKRINEIGITFKSEDEAREKLLEILEKEGIDGMEDESTDTLVDIAESFVSSTKGNDDEEEEEVAEDEEESEPDEDEVEDDEEEPEVEEAEEEDEEEEPEEPKKPAKKTSKKEEKKEVKKEEKKPSKKEDKKPAKKEEVKKEKGVKLNPQKNEEDRKHFEPLKKIFGSDFKFNWISKNGVAIKYVGKNGSKNAVKIKNAAIKDGEFICNLFIQTVKGGEILESIGITDYELNWNGYSFLRGVSMDELIEIVNQLIEGGMLNGLQNRDKRLGENRKKMEKSLKKSEVDEVEDDEDEVEEEPEVVEEKPAKKVASKKASKAKGKK